MKEMRLGSTGALVYQNAGGGLRGGTKDFYTTAREGARSFMGQRCSNARGRFMALVEYGGGGR